MDLSEFLWEHPILRGDAYIIFVLGFYGKEKCINKAENITRAIVNKQNHLEEPYMPSLLHHNYNDLLR